MRLEAVSECADPLCYANMVQLLRLEYAKSVSLLDFQASTKGRDGVLEYVKKTAALGKRLNLSEVDIIDQIKVGFNKDIREKMICVVYTSVKELSSAAEGYEKYKSKDHGKPRNDNQQHGLFHQPQQQPQQRYQPQPQYQQPQYPPLYQPPVTQVQQNQRPQQELKTTFQPQQLQQQGQQQWQQPQQYQQQARGRLACYTCGKTDNHDWKVCKEENRLKLLATQRNGQAVLKQEKPKVDFIEEIKSIKVDKYYSLLLNNLRYDCILDTGATISVINKHQAADLSLTLEYYLGEVIGGGTPIRILGKAWISIDLNGYAFGHYMAVLDSHYPIQPIIGRDVLKEKLNCEIVKPSAN